jgi:NAD(P)-dependent dehydrogenase (short-subunit alcohol dehydrogenase family)
MATSELHDQVVVITGGNSGIGKETAVNLARLGARVIITARNPSRGAAAREEIQARSGNADAEVMALDLASFESIRAFAKQFLGQQGRLDVLVNNAGLVLNKHRETADGFEMQFGVNHLGHFLLTTLLLDRLQSNTAGARVVVVSSHAHNWARRGLELDDLRSTSHYRAYGVYSKTKLANILFTRELARRLGDTQVTTNALHPGFVASRFSRDGDAGVLGSIGMVLGRPFAISPAKGARTSTYLASSPDVAGITGEYFYKCRPTAPSKYGIDANAARRLWDVSEQLVAGTG